MTTSRDARCRWTALTAALLAAGCGAEPFPMADVSGVVTLNGEPLEGAAVQFQPQRVGSDPLVGPGSVGVTDASGAYTLRSYKGGDGAVVGPHRVSISTYEARLKDPQNSDAIEVISEERVPQRYRAPSELFIEVPPGGTDEADFQLQSS